MSSREERIEVFEDTQVTVTKDRSYQAAMRLYSEDRVCFAPQILVNTD